LIQEVSKKLYQLAEPSLQEYKTRDYILSWITEWNLPFYVIGCSVIVLLKGESDLSYGYRCDMDAILVDGKYQHACGHHIHMTVALALIEKMRKERLNHSLYFIFQSAEETAQGAEILRPFLLSLCVYKIIGIHVLPGNQYQWISKEEAFFSGSQEFNIHLTGKGAHGAYPYQKKDLLLEAAILIIKIYSCLPRYFKNPPLLTIGNLKMDSMRNRLAGDIVLEGTIRYQSQSKEEIIRWLQEIIYPYSLDLLAGCNKVNSDKELLDIFDYYKEVEGYLYAEDFGNYLTDLSGIFLGNTCATGELHCSDFNIKKDDIEHMVDDLSVFLNKLNKKLP